MALAAAFAASALQSASQTQADLIRELSKDWAGLAEKFKEGL